MASRFIFPFRYLLVFFAFVFSSACSHPVDASENATKIDQETFISLIGYDSPENDQTIKQIADNWQPGYAPPLIELVYFSRDRVLRPKLFSLLQKKTNSEGVFELNSIYEKLWNQDIITPDWYPKFKEILYSRIDSRFSEYFKNTEKKSIRLDEIRWGGVIQNGIPPLRAPIMLKVSEADYLDDSNVVFGIEIDGDARAYPKRILAWHEMFIDYVGGKSVTGAYCTLCGSMILYNNEAGGKEHRLGTSGFLYRSNKLMFDEDTNSFWNTLLGEPVVGPLVGKGIALERLPVVTTTWGQWRKLHPETTVLSLKTGHKRDYSEGAAYREYFATDELMFNVPKLDKRLKNKAEILALYSSSKKQQPLAISSDFLKRNQMYTVNFSGDDYIILTDRSGAHRVYQTDNQKFTKWDQQSSLIDSAGQEWKATEASLVSTANVKLHRVPAHNAFWFGWYAAFPNTKLIH